MLSLLGLSVSIPWALAADPVVLYGDGTADAARARVVLEGKLAADTLSVTAFDAFRATLTAKWDGPGGLEACSGDAVESAQVDEWVAEAEKALLYFKFEDATTALDKAKSALPCLAAPVVPVTGARIGFLQGYVAIENEDQAAALEHFNGSSRFQPDLVWDEQYATEGAPQLKTAQQIVANTDPVSVGLVIEATSAETLWVDGHAVAAPASAVPMIPGPHLVQVKSEGGVHGYTADVTASTAPTMLLPPLLPSDGVAWVGHESGQARLGRVFSAVYEEGTPVFVTHRQGVWRTEVGSSEWSQLVAPSEKLVARGPIPAMAWLGTGVTSVLAAGTVVALGNALGATGKIDAAHAKVENKAKIGDYEGSGGAYEDEMSFREARTGAWIGTGLGLGLTTVGVLVTIPLFDGEAK